MMGNRQYCYPLTITDAHTRYLLACEGQHSTKEHPAFRVFEAAFKEYGIPQAIRTDNGIPFASPNALYGLSKLSVWWLRLGINIERIKPGCPQQNGRHERMHLTLKKETTKPAAFNLLQQQEKFDDFIKVYNQERPHEGIANHYPAELYTPSLKEYKGIPDVNYPFADRVIKITQCGRLCMGKRKINVSRSLAGQHVGVTQTQEKIWLVTFMKYELGYFDEYEDRLEPIDNPFASNVYTMSSV